MQYYLQGYDPGGGQLGEIDLAFFFFFANYYNDC